MTFAQFSGINRRRCERYFGRAVDETAVTAMAMGLAEEAGEVVGAVRSFLGISRGKTLGREEIGKELADVVAYADLLASSLGLDLGELVRAKFNEVSQRHGWPMVIEAQQ